MGIFTILWMVIKQIWKNWKLELVLLIGLTLAVAVFTSISLYTEGALQFVLNEALDRGGSTYRPIGSIVIGDDQWKDYHPILSAGRDGRDQNEAFAQFERLDDYLKAEIPTAYDTELIHFAQQAYLERSTITPLDKDEERTRRYADIRYFTQLEEMVDVIEGRWLDSSQVLTGNQVEVVIDAEARDNLNIMVGRTYLYPLIREDSGTRRYLELKVVGAFRVKEEYFHKPYWLTRPPFRDNFFVSKEVFEKLVLREDTQPYKYEWYWLFDNSELRVYDIASIVSNMRNVHNRANQMSNTLAFNTSILNIFQSIYERAELLRTLLFILSLPVMGMILYYIILAASLIINRRSNEIAMLRSRGAGIIQIFMSYILEWSILGLITLAIGPYLGLYIARIMGAASGFLSFVGRKPLPVTITPSTYQYGVLAVLVIIISCLVLVFPAARQSIVTYKQNLARASNKSLWKRFYFDFILLGFSLFGYRVLQQQITNIQQGAQTNSQLLLDPLIFLVPILFVATAGLLALRVLPWIIKLISMFTNYLSDICLTMTLRQFFRNPGQFNALLFFIIMTVSLGIYSASIARTLDQNYFDGIMYEIGADVVLTENWAEPDYSAEPINYDDEDEMDMGLTTSTPTRVAEPPFYVHKQMPGVIDAARVLRNRVNFTRGGTGTLMAIDPHDFAQVTWFRDDLVPHHLHEYLNLLISYQEGALVSREFYEDNSYQLGDWLSIRMDGEELEFYIVGVIDLWPTVYPQSFPLLVVNLDYVQSQYIIQPYNVWLRLEEGASLTPIVENLREEGIWVTGIKDSRAQLIEGRRDPQRMGLFGMLSIGFVVAVLISVLGFFLYTFLSLKNRMLQFGVLRAIGLSVPQLLMIICLEQLFSVGLAFVLGTIFGIIASRVFLPFMQVTQSIEGVVPDFLIIIQHNDIIRILLILGITIIIALIGLGIVLSRMRLHQAIQLGEET